MRNRHLQVQQYSGTKILLIQIQIPIHVVDVVVFGTSIAN